MTLERNVRRALVLIAIGGLAAGVIAQFAQERSLGASVVDVGHGSGNRGLAIPSCVICWPRWGGDAIALLSMGGALALGQPLAGAVIALMYSGGNVLEDFAVGRAERDLRSLVDRAPRVAHRRLDHRIEDVPVANVAVGDTLLVRGGEIIPVDGVIASMSAVIDSRH